KLGEPGFAGFSFFMKRKVHGSNGGQKKRKEKSTDPTVAKRIEKQRPRIQPWPKESKSNVHGSNCGQRNRKATATDPTVAKEIEKQRPRIQPWQKESMAMSTDPTVAKRIEK